MGCVGAVYICFFFAVQISENEASHCPTLVNIADTRASDNESCPNFCRFDCRDGISQILFERFPLFPSLPDTPPKSNNDYQIPSGVSYRRTQQPLAREGRERGRGSLWGQAERLVGSGPVPVRAERGRVIREALPLKGTNTKQSEEKPPIWCITLGIWT